MPIVPAQNWADPNNEVDCLPGGFLYDDQGGTIERSVEAPEEPAPKKRSRRKKGS